MRRRHLIIASLSATAVAASAVGAIASSSSTKSLRGDTHFAPAQFSSQLGHVPAVQTGAPSSILGEIVKRADVADVKNSVLVAAPAGSGHRAGFAFNARVDVPAAGAPAIRGLWDAQIVEGDVAESLAYSHNEPIVGGTITGVLPSGKPGIVMPGALGNTTDGQQFSSASDSEIAAAVNDALQGTGAKLVSLDIVRADQPAPAVVVQVDDAQTALALEPKLLGNLFYQGQPLTPIYEGFYFEIVDQFGTPLAVYATSARTAGTLHWDSPNPTGQCTPGNSCASDPGGPPLHTLHP